MASRIASFLITRTGGLRPPLSRRKPMDKIIERIGYGVIIFAMIYFSGHMIYAVFIR